MPHIQQPPWGFLMHAGTKLRHNWRAWKPKSPYLDYLDLREIARTFPLMEGQGQSLPPSLLLTPVFQAHDARACALLIVYLYVFVGVAQINELCQSCQCMPMHRLHIPRLLLGDHTSAQKCRLLLQASKSVTGMPLCFVLHHLPCEMNKLRWTRLNSPAMSSTSVNIFNFYIANELAVWNSLEVRRAAGQQLYSIEKDRRGEPTKEQRSGGASWSTWKWHSLWLSLSTPLNHSQAMGCSWLFTSISLFVNLIASSCKWWITPPHATTTTIHTYTMTITTTRCNHLSGCHKQGSGPLCFCLAEAAKQHVQKGRLFGCLQ